MKIMTGRRMILLLYAQRRPNAATPLHRECSPAQTHRLWLKFLMAHPLCTRLPHLHHSPNTELLTVCTSSLQDAGVSHVVCLPVLAVSGPIREQSNPSRRLCCIQHLRRESSPGFPTFQQNILAVHQPLLLPGDPVSSERHPNRCEC